MSDFLKKIKSVFIVNEAEGSGTENSSAQVVKSEPATSAPPGPAGEKTTSGGQFYDLLFESLEKNNQEGFDYFEFRKSIQSLSRLSMDEPTRYQSAYAAAQAMGTSKERLVETAGIYLGILKQEEKKFGEALAAQREKQIGDKERQITGLENELKAKTEEIARLTKQIEDGQAEAEKLRTGIAEAVQKLDVRKEEFNFAYQDLSSQIGSDISKIGEYLK